MIPVAELVSPGSTAVLTMELQRGVVGPSAALPALAEAVESAGTVRAAAHLCDAARSVGCRVIHCTAETRADGAGGSVNAPLLAMADRHRRQNGSPIETGTEGAQIMAELGPDERDILMPRIHGLTPFTSTALDQILRNLGVTTVVVAGVSVNIGVFGLCTSAVDLGYQVVVARDAVAGVPADYAQAVIDNALSLVATVADVDDIVAAWSV